MIRYKFYDGVDLKLSPLKTLEATTISHCILRCNVQTGCGAVKVTDGGGNGRMACQLYKEYEAGNAEAVTDIYVMEYRNDN